MAIKREQILAAVQAALAAIAEGDDYDYTLAGRVFLRRTDIVPPSEFPVVLLIPGDSPASVLAGGTRQHSLALSVVAMAKTMPIAAGILADVLKCIGANKKWGGLAEGTEISSISDGKQTEGHTACMVSADLSIKYETGLWAF
jgi:hypothetical protein